MPSRYSFYVNQPVFSGSAGGFILALLAGVLLTGPLSAQTESTPWENGRAPLKTAYRMESISPESSRSQTTTAENLFLARSDIGNEAALAHSGVAPRRVTIEEIAQEAAAVHPSVRQAAEIVNSFQGSFLQAGLAKNPSIGYIADEVGGFKGAGRQGIAVSQEIVPASKRAARQNAVTAEQKAAMQALEIQRQKVTNDASCAACRLLIAQNRERLMKELLDVCQKSAETAHQLTQAGDAPKTDYLQAKIELRKAEMALNDAVFARKAASQTVAVFLAADPQTEYEVTDSLPQIAMDCDRESLYRQLMEESPQLKKAQAQLSAANAQAARENAEAKIELNAEGGVVYNTYENQTEVSAGISLPLRLYDRNQGNIMKAQYEIQAAAANVERVKSALQAAFGERWAQFDAARSRVQFYRENVLADTEESLQLIMQAYRQGQSSYLEVLTAMATAYNAQAEYLTSLETLLETQTVLRGSLLQGAFDQPE